MTERPRSEHPSPPQGQLRAVVAAWHAGDRERLAALLGGAAVWVPGLVDTEAADTRDVDRLLAYRAVTLTVDAAVGDDAAAVLECRAETGDDGTAGDDPRPVTLVLERDGGRRRLRVYLDTAAWSCPDATAGGRP